MQDRTKSLVITAEDQVSFGTKPIDSNHRFGQAHLGGFVDDDEVELCMAVAGPQQLEGRRKDDNRLIALLRLRDQAIDAALALNTLHIISWRIHLAQLGAELS